MKVVLFCGGLGMRLKDTEESLPKPLVKIGNMPILWHVMKYYAYYGHKDFILCLGYKADLIKQHFLNYNECLLNDFVLTNGGRNVELLSSDMRDWKITFVDTGMYCTVGQRLKLVQRHLEGEEMFLTNYSDGLTNMPLTQLIDFAKQQNTIATFLCVKPNLTYHFVSLNDPAFGARPLKRAIQRLIQDRQLTAFSYDGFWAAIDTFKDKQQLEELHARGHAPWEVWKNPLPEAKTN